MFATPLLYKYILPKVWDYFQTHIINVGSAAMGSSCYEIKQRNVINVTEKLLRIGESKWECPVSDLPVTLLVDLFAASSVRKFVLESNENMPQHVRVEYSIDGTKNSFKTLKVIHAKDLKKGTPFIIDVRAPVKAKYFKVRIMRGKNQKDDSTVSLSKIEIYGSPLITPENLANIEYSKALSSIYEKAKNIGFKSQQQEQDTQNKDDGVKFQVIEPDEEDKEKNTAEFIPNHAQNKHEKEPSIASGSKSEHIYFKSKL